MSRNEPDRADAAWKWWSALQPAELNGRCLPGDRAAIARLKRAGNVLEAASEPATAELYGRLGFDRPERDLPRAALVAAVLAHVRKDVLRKDVRPMPFAAAIGVPRAGADGSPLVTPLRFKRLVAAREPDEMLIAFRRAVAILGHSANVKNLASVLIAWTDPDERRADIARTRFAFDYHGAGEYAPDAATGTDAETTTASA